MQKQKQANLVHLIVLRERKRPPHKPRQSLTQDAIKSFDVAGLPCPFARRSMLSFRQHFGIGGPEIRVQQTAFVGGRNPLPQQAAGGLASVADGIRNDLAGAAALGQPNPALVSAKPNKRPHFVQLQHVVRLSGGQCLAQRRQMACFFLARR